MANCKDAVPLLVESLREAGVSAKDADNMAANIKTRYLENDGEDIDRIYKEHKGSAIKAAARIGDIDSTVKMMLNESPKMKKKDAVFNSIMSVIIDTMRHAHRGGPSLETTKRVFNNLVMTPFVNKMDESNAVKLINDAAKNGVDVNAELAAGLLGKTGQSPEINRIGKLLKEAVDNANKINPDVQMQHLHLHMNSLNIKKFVDVNGLDGLRKFLIENTNNGERVYQNLINDNPDAAVFNHHITNKIDISTPEQYIAMANKFSDGNLFDNVKKGLDRHADELGIYEKLGHRPFETLEILRKHYGIKENSHEHMQLKRWLTSQTNGFSHTYGNSLFVRALKGTRSLMGAAMLGRSGLLTPIDKATAVSHLSSLGIKVPANIFKPLSTVKSVEHQVANIYGIGTQELAANMMDSMPAGRFMNLGEGGDQGKVLQFVNKWASKTMRLYGIQDLTLATRRSFAAQLAASIGKDILDGKSWNDLHVGLRRSFEQSGINESNWHRLNKESVSDGVIIPQNLNDEDMWLKLNGYILTQTDIGVTNARAGDDLLLKFIEPGTVLYELATSALQFQKFAVALMRNQYYMLSALPDSKMATLKASSTLLGTSLMMGWIIHGLREGANNYGKAVAGTIDYEEANEEMLNMLFPSETEDRIHMAERLAFYTGIANHMVMLAAEVANISGVTSDLFGVRSYRFNDNLDILGPSAAVLKMVKGTFGEMFDEGDFSPDEAAAKAVHDLTKLAPLIGSFPVIKHMTDEWIRDPLRDVYRG